MEWLALKAQLSQFVSLDRDALHIYAAIAIQCAVAMITRRPLSHLLPWLAVLGLALLNEWADLTYEVWPEVDRTLQWFESAHDLVNTMAVPTMLLLALRYRSRLIDGEPWSGRDRKPNPPSDS